MEGTFSGFGFSSSSSGGSDGGYGSSYSGYGSGYGGYGYGSSYGGYSSGGYSGYGYGSYSSGYSGNCGYGYHGGYSSSAAGSFSGTPGYASVSGYAGCGDPACECCGPFSYYSSGPKSGDMGYLSCSSYVAERAKRSGNYMQYYPPVEHEPRLNELGVPIINDSLPPYEFGFDFAEFGKIMLNIIATIFFPIPITYRWIRCVIDGIIGDFASREPMESLRPW